MGSELAIEHVNVKIFAGNSAVDLSGAIAVFQRWIQENACEELLIDVADYRHVPAGPGVVLVGHEANYSLDQSFDRLGLLYGRKMGSEGSVQDKLLQAFYSALAACRRLQGEPEFQGNLKFNAGECEVILNDRLLAPNNEVTWEFLKSEFENFFARVYGAGNFTVEHVGEPRERFRVSAKANRAVAVQSLLEAHEPRAVNT